MESATKSKGPPVVDRPAPAWHSMTAADAAGRMAVAPEFGLSAGQVTERRKAHGENRLAEKQARSKWLKLLDQFKSMLILVLIGAAVLAGIIGDAKDFIVIMVVVVFNALLGFWQEYRAERTLDALKKMLSPTAKVRRDGTVSEIPAVDLVPGDIILLDAGDRVPADGRILLGRSLEIDEAALTGESHPVVKNAEKPAPEVSALADRTDMAYMNSVVTRGRGELLATATGMATEMGRLSGMIAE
ncbi:MAG TPA: HAD-IC family P-type ATPase, partial [Magnetospirillaceae bacterium]|nr:HAD-IC family P-type ATPase [Magnetospirillaceae bacterium]